MDSKLAATLAFGWAAYPYTAYALESNSNDTLVAALLIAALLFLSRPVARGTLLALATLTKFAPVVLVPMYATFRGWRGNGGVRPGEAGSSGSTTGPAARTPRATGRAAIAFVLAFALTAALLMIWPTIDPGLSTVYDRTIAYQADRDSPFSIWGQTSLEPLRYLILAATAALSLAFAFVPRRKSLIQVAALSAALLIAIQLTAQHWFYLYVVWFYPLLLVAMASRAQEPSPARSSRPGRGR